MIIARPGPDEFAPYYAPYVAAPEGEDLLEVLAGGLERTLSLAASVPADREEFRYAPEKWSVREVLGHMVDAERVFGVRAVTFARADPGPLPSFDENAWVAASNAHTRPLADIADEFGALRRSHLLLARSLEPEALARWGVASGNPVTVRGMFWIMAGHETHHRQILRDRYLGG